MGLAHGHVEWIYLFTWNPPLFLLFVLFYPHGEPRQGSRAVLHVDAEDCDLRGLVQCRLRAANASRMADPRMARGLATRSASGRDDRCANRQSYDLPYDASRYIVPCIVHGVHVHVVASRYGYTVNVNHFGAPGRAGT